ncbi:MAG: SDR family oxidoreductase [Calditrichaeota bacterium]|nr:SDR family oxidoreductase [Calditrichota bacterium]MCB9366450.1 SDR family oxidoreductase [Calditrichota bacterium]MCB9391292.1 SDR family oxidoreductase [Calditrichota bacterium]
MNVLVTGASGLLGAAVCLRLQKGGHVVCGTHLSHIGPFPFPSAKVDLRERVDVEALVKSFAPDAIVHAAALSKVLECQRNPIEARRHNVDATRHLAELAKQSSCYFLYVSTDQVFSGKTGMHTESEAVSPTHIYGELKAECEKLLQNLLERRLILRSNNIVGSNKGFGKSFTDGVLESLLAGKSVELFDDQIRSPIHLDVMSELILRCVEDAVQGILHAGGPERLSRYQTGLQLAEAFGGGTNRIHPVSFKTHAESDVLQSDGSFDTTKFRELYPDLGNERISTGFERDAKRVKATLESPS